VTYSPFGYPFFAERIRAKVLKEGGSAVLSYRSVSEAVYIQHSTHEYLAIYLYSCHNVVCFCFFIHKREAAILDKDLERALSPVSTKQLEGDLLNRAGRIGVKEAVEMLLERGEWAQAYATVMNAEAKQ